MTLKPIKIGFVSTRFHGTDGVTLEAAKWAQVLESQGHKCFWFAGKLDTPEPVSMLCEKAFFDHPQVLELQSKLFGTRTRPRALTNEIQAIKEELKDALYEFIETFELDLVIPQNILAIPMHIPLGLAMTEVISETRIPAIAHHHDFAWERERFSIRAVPDYLAMAFPPQMHHKFQHVVINSAGQNALASRCGLSSIIVPNVIDFGATLERDEIFASDFREEFGIAKNEILVLQPTRIVNRKGIEHAIELVRKLQSPNRKVSLVVSHDAGDEGFEYMDMLKERAREVNIRMIFIGHRISETRSIHEDGTKVYTLWDIYPHADFVTYPSLYEGFGNALLETMYFRKPILVNRYSVYVRDIEPLGFKVVEMDSIVTQGVAEKVDRLLNDKQLATEWAEHNFELGNRYFSYGVLRKKLNMALLEIFGD